MINQTVPDCLMCAVRQLTEGRPREWAPTADGDSVSGVVLRTGMQPSHFRGGVAFVDLWLGGMDRIRVTGHSVVMDNAIQQSEAKIGDRMTVTYEGHRPIEKGRHAGQQFRMFTVEVERGHH